MNKSVFTLLCALLTCGPTFGQDAGEVQVLHEFMGRADGDNPNDLACRGNNLYGTTSSGGSHNDGTIYSVNADGTGYRVLLHFDRDTTGSNPGAGLTIVTNSMYGTTKRGGSHGGGTLFCINTDGTRFRVLHHFGKRVSRNGEYFKEQGQAESGLVADGASLYGTTISEVYATNMDGSGFRVLHEFGREDGHRFKEQLTLVGSTLYGVAPEGGMNDSGTVFAVNTDGTEFRVLHHFDLNKEGRAPRNPELTVVESRLFGSTESGGENDRGVIYSLNLDGSDFRIVCDFDSKASNVMGGLALRGTKLFGAATSGGKHGNGALFAVNTDGSQLTVLYDCNVSGGDFRGVPTNKVTLNDSKMFCTISYAGKSALIALSLPVDIPAPAEDVSGASASSVSKSRLSVP